MLHLRGRSDNTQAERASIESLGIAVSRRKMAAECRSVGNPPVD